MSVFATNVIPFPSFCLAQKSLTSLELYIGWMNWENVTHTKILWYKVTTIVPHSSLPHSKWCPINVYRLWGSIIIACSFYHFYCSMNPRFPLLYSSFMLLVTWDHFILAHGKHSRWFLRFACRIPMTITEKSHSCDFPLRRGWGYLHEPKQLLVQRASLCLLTWNSSDFMIF